MDDIVERLRGAGNGYPAAYISCLRRLLPEAADEIERLRSRVKVLTAVAKGDYVKAMMLGDSRRLDVRNTD